MRESTCGGPECTRLAGTSGMCRSHYKQWHLGKPLAPLRVATKNLGRPASCTFIDCHRPHKARGLCKTHNSQAKQGQELRPIQEYGLGLICTANECGRAAVGRGLCSRHRQVEYDLAIKYNITVDQYEMLLKEQGGCCAICGANNPNGYRLSIDHDHACCPGDKSCGRCIRGLLCSKCNLILGHANDDATRLRAAIDYLNSRSQERVLT